MENHRLAMNQKLLYAGEVQIVGMSENRVPEKFYLVLVYPMISLIFLNIISLLLLVINPHVSTIHPYFVVYMSWYPLVSQHFPYKNSKC